MQSISLYIHIPFCRKKCYYCDFNSYSGKEDLIGAYINGLIKEISIYKSLLKNHTITTIFFGGGTPSLLEAKEIGKIMEEIQKNYPIDKEAEISLEANPGTLSYGKLKGYHRAGINRLSIGLQACQNPLLKLLGRSHNLEDYLKNIGEARKAGFININTDLMFGLPGQTEEDWRLCLEKIVDLDIGHISAYNLIVEEGTPLYDWVDRGRIQLPQEDLEIGMYHYVIDYLKAKGYRHYEISNFARPGFESRHNLVYWHNRPYIGLGVGAHSYFNNKRFSNLASIGAYINTIKDGRLPIEKEIGVTRRDEISETMFLGLRLVEGISIKEFTERFNLSPFKIYEKQIKKFVGEGLLEYDDRRIRLTQKGIDISNIVFQEFLLD